MTEWLSEQQVSERSGLPGPLVAVLIPRRNEGTGEHYHRDALLYPGHAVYAAQTAQILLAAGVRVPLVRAAAGERITAEHVAETRRLFPAASAAAVCWPPDGLQESSTQCGGLYSNGE